MRAAAFWILFTKVRGWTVVKVILDRRTTVGLVVEELMLPNYDMLAKPRRKFGRLASSPYAPYRRALPMHC